MRIEQKAEKTLLLLLIDKPAALGIPTYHCNSRSRQVGQVAAYTRTALRTGDVGSLGAAGAGIF